MRFNIELPVNMTKEEIIKIVWPMKEQKNGLEQLPFEYNSSSEPDC